LHCFLEHGVALSRGLVVATCALCLPVVAIVAIQFGKKIKTRLGCILLVDNGRGILVVKFSGGFSIMGTKVLLFL